MMSAEKTQTSSRDDDPYDDTDILNSAAENADGSLPPGCCSGPVGMAAAAAVTGEKYKSMMLEDLENAG
ncbi:nuclear respiratory factor 1 isoform X1 [Lates japonicus]|uniref:Nuclear respiratory factor 1 isoform X1 n=1 Tax=Lates japonicus TaxID=270547 RepID=A0AAD3QXJ9_LATJO|nr:nuclear respiratory factor 1 isoform X1 [Lates japonicus]